MANGPDDRSCECAGGTEFFCSCRVVRRWLPRATLLVLTTYLRVEDENVEMVTLASGFEDFLQVPRCS